MKAFRTSLLISVGFGLGLLPLELSFGAETETPEVEWAAGAFFEEQVLPILESACLECHSHESESVKGGFYLDSRSGWELGGNSGQVIVPRDTEASLLVHAIRYSDEDLQMPPKGKRLSEEQVAVIEKWIRLGAFAPRVSEVKTQKRVAHWAFLPLEKPSIPEVKNPAWAQ